MSNVTFSSSSPAAGRRSPSPPRPRHRPLARSATFGIESLPSVRRRTSFFSENVSETRKSLRSSTDDLLLPRVNGSSQFSQDSEPSHWHSVPLGLALLPAVAGLVFRDGSAVVTDITLLALAAIFLNWSVRLPWDWYHSAQATRPGEQTDSSRFDTIAEEGLDHETQDATSSLEQDGTPPPAQRDNGDQRRQSSLGVEAAQRELQKHELLALSSCFIFPIVGAWLLHAIRGELSRPSEGLVSNYNLTVFILAAEIRPVSHLIKMVQARTLFLQRMMNANTNDDDPRLDSPQMIDMLKRVEELESHIAGSVEDSGKRRADADQLDAGKMTAQAVVETRKCVQPEVDALNRAVRRYEKRTTISSLQTEARLHDLESRLNDVVVLAAAVQRTVEAPPKNYMLILLNWVCAAIVLPAQLAAYLVRLPLRALQWATGLVHQPLISREVRSARQMRQGNQARVRDRKSKPTI